MTEEQDKIEQEFKSFLVQQYKANGGANDISGLSIEGMKLEVQHAIELKKLNEKIAQADALPTQSQQIQGIDKAKENAQAMARDVIQAINYLDPPFDERTVFRQGFKRDNELILDSAIEGESIVLRDEKGETI